MSDQAIMMVSQARNLLERASKPEEWREIMRVASAAKAYLRARDDAHVAWICAGEIELRAKKRLADYIAKQPKAPPPPGPGRGKVGSTPDPSFTDPTIETPTLEYMGIQKGRVAQEYRALAKVSPVDFDSRLRATVDAGRMPSVAAVTTVSADADYDGDSWCTPPDMIERAREAMGGIDIDPASNVRAQETVRATTFYTRDDDGLSKPWPGRVWLNPPYSTTLVQAFAERVLVRDFDQAIVLVNNCTDASWWHSLAAAAAVTAFTRGRVAFVHPRTGVAFATRQGQTLFYFGGRAEVFADVFSRDGACAIFARLV